MEKLLFQTDELKKFITQVQTKSGKNIEYLAKKLNVSGKTLRDWKREKFKPTKSHIIELSRWSGVKLPTYQILPQYWHIKKAAKLGGQKRYEQYGLLGTIADRSKGGKASWIRRKNNSALWNKYVKNFQIPNESIDLAEFIGIMLGDGGLTIYQCVIYLNSETEKKYALYVKNLIFKLFGLTANICQSKRYKVLRVSISSVNLVKYLKSKGLSLGNKVHLQVGVPSWVINNPEFTKACIKGLVDTDGCFVIHKYKIKNKEYTYPKIAFYNRSEPLLNFVFEKLKQLRFTPKRTFKYQVWLHNQNEVARYLQEIGVSNYKPSVKRILEGGPDGKAMVC